MRVLFFIIPEEGARGWVRGLRGLGHRLSFLFPGLSYDLKLAGAVLDEGEYIAASLLNALLWGALMLLLTGALFFSRGLLTQQMLMEAVESPEVLRDFLLEQKLAFLPAVLTVVLLFVFFMRYPRIQAGKIVETVERDLIYALKDLLVQINSGVSLYNAMVNVSRAGYGRISDEFAMVVQDIETGMSQEAALERMALRTESKFLRRTIWQIVTALKAGASLQGALGSILLSLRQYQSSNIKAYTQELNLWVLLYIMVAVAIPSLGVTLLVILSTFGGVGLSEGFIILLLFACFFAEIVLIEFIKIRRPVLRV